MKFDIYGRFQLEVLRENEAWTAYRLAPGANVADDDWRAHGEGFQHRQRLAFIPHRWKHQCAGGAELLLDFVRAFPAENPGFGIFGF